MVVLEGHSLVVFVIAYIDCLHHVVSRQHNVCLFLVMWPLCYSSYEAVCDLHMKESEQPFVRIMVCGRHEAACVFFSVLYMLLSCLECIVIVCLHRV